jgi:hypothetical protein
VNGNRTVGAITLQWQRSGGDAESGYADLPGVTGSSATDTTAPADGSGRYYRAVVSAPGAASVTSAADRGSR